MSEVQLIRKTALAAKKLAVLLSEFNEADRVPTIKEMSESLDLSRGTTQLALNYLQESGAVILESHGHMGTTLVKIDYPKLLSAQGVQNLVGVMPLPYSKKYEGFATGLSRNLNSGPFPTYIAFMRGSNNRLKAMLSGRYDFAVMSALAAAQYMRSKENVRVVRNFGPYSYVGRHVVLVRDDFDGNFEGIRVGIDESSIDQKNLTYSCFRNTNVEYVPLVYTQILAELRDRKIDAAVWNADDINFALLGLTSYPLPENAAESGDDTAAVIVCSADNRLVARVLQQTLDIQQVREIQKQVEQEEIIPNY